MTEGYKYYKEEKRRISQISEIGKFTKGMMSQLRETIWALNADNISFEQLVVRVSEYVKNARKSYPDIFFRIETGELNRNFNSEQAIHLFRTIQEAINNAIKHANASEISIICKNDYIEISDDGKGAHLENIISGNGLKNMKERMKIAGFIPEFDSEPGNGMSIKLLL